MVAIIQKKTVDYYDLFEIMYVMECNGYMSKDKFWSNYATEYGVNNNSIFWLDFGYYACTDKECIYKEYFVGLNKLLNLPDDNDGIMVETSW